MRLQGVPSTVCGHVLGVRPGDTVIDLCAAPGGKSTHMAALMRGEGILVACDHSRSKVRAIEKTPLAGSERRFRHCMLGGARVALRGRFSPCVDRVLLAKTKEASSVSPTPPTPPRSAPWIATSGASASAAPTHGGRTPSRAVCCSAATRWAGERLLSAPCWREAAATGSAWPAFRRRASIVCFSTRRARRSGPRVPHVLPAAVPPTSTPRIRPQCLPAFLAGISSCRLRPRLGVDATLDVAQLQRLARHQRGFIWTAVMLLRPGARPAATAR